MSRCQGKIIWHSRIAGHLVGQNLHNQLSETRITATDSLCYDMQNLKPIFTVNPILLHNTIKFPYLPPCGQPLANHIPITIYKTLQSEYYFSSLDYKMKDKLVLKVLKMCIGEFFLFLLCYFSSTEFSLEYIESWFNVPTNRARSNCSVIYRRCGYCGIWHRNNDFN